jgi:hypothetical protein
MICLDRTVRLPRGRPTAPPLDRPRGTKCEGLTLTQAGESQCPGGLPFCSLSPDLFQEPRSGLGALCLLTLKKNEPACYRSSRRAIKAWYRASIAWA